MTELNIKISVALQSGTELLLTEAQKKEIKGAVAKIVFGEGIKSEKQSQTNKVKRYKHRTYKHWTEEENQVLLELAKKNLPTSEIRKDLHDLESYLGRNKASVLTQYHRILRTVLKHRQPLIKLPNFQ